MLTMFAVRSPQSQRQSSILCRVLDGRELDGICPIDEAILSLDERASYRHLGSTRQRALAYRTRSELRRMLGRELGFAPQHVPLVRDSYGKPRCADHRAEGMDFSVSHTDDCAIIAIGEAQGLGVDVESVIEEEPEEEMLEVLFSEGEKNEWRKLPASRRRMAFTQAWTIKEAVLKAEGTGLHGSPHSVRVTFDEEFNARPVFRSRRWFFEPINLSEDYAASFVALMPDEANTVSGLYALQGGLPA